MKRTGKIAIGIDVTESRIHMVVLRRTPTGCAVLDAATASVPERAIEAGRITDPKLLARTLKTLRRRSWATSGTIAISLPPQATLTRIIPLTEQDPQRIGQFVRDEIKQYAILSGREAASDFRVLSAARQDTRGAVLVAAADRENVTALTTACRLAGLQIGIIEPPALACARLLGASRGSGTADRGLMIVLCKGATLTLCAFRRGLLDFVRTELLESEAGGSDALGRRIAEEVAAVMRFYSLRGSDAVKEWKVVLADDDRSSTLAPVQATLGNDTAESVSLVTPESLPAELAIDFRGHKDISLTALGLASRTDTAIEWGSSVNLVPAEVRAFRSTRKNLFVLANAAALLLLAVILGTGAVGYVGRRLHQNVIAMKQQALQKGERSLPATVDEIVYVDEQMKKLTEEVKYLEDIGQAHTAVNWEQFLNDVQNAVPPHRVLKLDSLTSNDGSIVTLSGLAVSTDAVVAFVDALNASAQVRHASRKEWKKTGSGLIKYEIQCVLSAGKVS